MQIEGCRYFFLGRCLPRFCLAFSRLWADLLLVSDGAAMPTTAGLGLTATVLVVTLVAPTNVPSFSRRKRSAKLLVLPRAEGGTYLPVGLGGGGEGFAGLDTGGPFAPRRSSFVALV